MVKLLWTIFISSYPEFSTFWSILPFIAGRGQPRLVTHDQIDMGYYY